MPATLLRKRLTLTQLFSTEFCKISKNTFFTEHFRTTTFAQKVNFGYFSIFFIHFNSQNF